MMREEMEWERMRGREGGRKRRGGSLTMVKEYFV